MKRQGLIGSAIAAGVLLAAVPTDHIAAQSAGPTLVDPNLAVKTVVEGLSQPTSMAFLGRSDFLVLEKASGKVQRVIDGVAQATPVLDLAVNSASERGLLGIALHPRFPRDRGVYLYWTESTARDAAGLPLDSADLAMTPLLGNRVDRFVWSGSTLRFDRNLIRLRAFQADAGQPLRGNHNAGVIRFERSDDDDRDGKRHGNDDDNDDDRQGPDNDHSRGHDGDHDDHGRDHDGRCRR